MSTRIVFTATNGTQGTETWISDGTPSGTLLLNDILAGTGTSNAAGFFDFGNGHMLFSANNGSQGRELWVTDGTAAGTSLLKDIRTMPANLAGTTPGGGYPNGFFMVSPGRALFAGNDGSNGSELWVTDGTAAGTSLLKDINPGTFVSSGLTLGNSAAPSEFIKAQNGMTVFAATTVAEGTELWTTDGTAAGTSLLMDINPGSATSSTGGFHRLADGRLLFGAISGTIGRELWITDGTSAGTSLVADIRPGTGSGLGYGGMSGAVALGNGKVLFTPYSNPEPWVTDGTAAGTYLLQEIRAGVSYGSNPSGITPIGGGRAVFSANNVTNGTELWITDGTIVGTSMLADLNPGPAGSVPQGFTAVPGGKFVFSAQGPGTAGRELWVTDGTAAGTSQVLDMFPGATIRYGTPYANSGGPSMVGRLNDGRALFTATDATVGRELWVTDGTAIGTSLVKDINPLTTVNNSGPALPAGSNPSNFKALGDGRFAFTASDGLTGTELWITDGTTAGTVRAADINTINAGSNTQAPTQNRIFTSIGGGRFAFTAFDGVTGNELWITDGTAAGTSLLLDIVPGNNNSGATSVFSLGDGRAIFNATSGTIARELWVTDGTAAGTSLVKDINPNPGGSSVAAGVILLSPGRALMTASDGVNGNELWVTDGTASGTSLLKDINAGAGNSYGRYFTAFGAGALFSARTAAEGNELWFTDGTAAGTTFIKDIRAGTADSLISRMTVLGGNAVFAATDGVSGNELWVTDGTAGGTSLLADIRVGASSSYPRDITALGNGKAVFRANNGTTGNELWVTDGTAAGTSLVMDIAPGSYGSMNGAPVAIGGGRAVFAAFNSSLGNELWVTDGTAAGTSLMVDIVPGSGGSSPAYITALGNGKIVFAASVTGLGTELWATDGTAAGTLLLRDFNPGAGDSFPRFFRATGDGRALFEGNDPATGRETWITDGTVAGTKLVIDINPVTNASGPSALTVFQANDAPVLSAAIADQSINEDSPLAFAVPAGTFTDPNPWDSPLSYSAQLAGGGALPSWLTFDAGSVSFSGTPANGDVGTQSIRVTATDSFGKSVSDVFDLTVVNTNDTPMAAAFATDVAEDATGSNLWSSLLGLATDDDLIHGDALTLAGADTTGTLGHVVFDAGTQTLRYVADADVFDALPTGQTMVDTFTYTVRDIAGAISSATVSVTVTGLADSVITFGARAVSDPSLGGSIDGAEGANNVAQNQIVASEFVNDDRDRFQQFLAFVDDAPGGGLGGTPGGHGWGHGYGHGHHDDDDDDHGHGHGYGHGGHDDDCDDDSGVVAGADRAYNLSDIGNHSDLTALSQANNALDPVLITAHGIINSKSLGLLTNDIHFINDDFGVENGRDNSREARWLNDGDSVTFRTTGYDCNVNNLIRAVGFTVNAEDCDANLVLDWDGAVTEDLNGSNNKGGFATESETLRFDDLSDGARVEIDFYARTISIDDVTQAGTQAWFAARAADNGLQSLTLGSSMNGGGWAVADLKLDTVAGVPVAGGGFVNALF